MPRSLQMIAILGPAYTGLSTVGYKLVNSLGVVVQARTTSGVSEIGGGTYTGLVSFPDDFEGYIYWDTTEGSAVSASETYNQDTLAPTIDIAAIAAQVAALGGSSGSSGGSSGSSTGAASTGTVAASAQGVYLRGDLRARVRQRVGPKARGLLDDDPFTLNDIQTEIVDDMARRSWCYFRSMTADLEEDVAVYCSPEKPGWFDMFEVVSAEAKDRDGNPVILTPRTWDEMTRRYPSWRQAPSSGIPSLYIVRAPAVEVYAVPDYDMADGLTFWGYCTPGRSWDDEDSAYPLPQHTLETAVYGVASRWLLALVADKEIRAMQQEYAAIYEAGLSRIYGESLRQLDRGGMPAPRLVGV